AKWRNAYFESVMMPRMSAPPGRSPAQQSTCHAQMAPRTPLRAHAAPWRPDPDARALVGVREWTAARGSRPPSAHHSGVPAGPWS
ncbi:MAG TPA: hypothetical protein VFO79_01670, partial [Xanthomonadales bacterium]|nr:hypothetical protein [Xanthomonadales bacterium]